MSRSVLLLITDLELGGLPTVVRELAVRLSRQGAARVEVACLAGWGPVADQLTAAGVKVTALGARSAGDLAVAGKLVGLIRRGRFDTVLSFLVHANVMAAVASLVDHQVRYLQCIQTTQPYPRWHWWAQAAAESRAARIVVPSESVAQVMRDWSLIPPEKIVIIPNAVEPAEFERSPVPQADARPYPIGFIGRLDPIKRIPDLLEAAAMLGDLIHLHVYGTGEQGEFLRAEVARLGLGSSVTMHGSIARAQAVLGTLGLLVLPSDAEGFGIVLIEAMAAGVPVVATAVPGIRDVVRPGETGLLVPPRSPAALAAAIRRVVEDRALRVALIDAGLRDVSERFTWERVLQKFRQLLEIPG